MGETELRIEVPEALRPGAAAAVARLSYLHPSVGIAISDDLRVITAKIRTDASAFRRDINYALYREKIYAETLGMREALVAAVTKK